MPVEILQAGVNGFSADRTLADAAAFVKKVRSSDDHGCYKVLQQWTPPRKTPFQQTIWLFVAWGVPIKFQPPRSSSSCWHPLPCPTTVKAEGGLGVD